MNNPYEADWFPMRRESWWEGFSAGLKYGNDIGNLAMQLGIKDADDLERIVKAYLRNGIEFLKHMAPYAKKMGYDLQPHN